MVGIEAETVLTMAEVATEETMVTLAEIGSWRGHGVGWTQYSHGMRADFV